MWNIGRIWNDVLIVCSKLSFSNNSYLIDTSQLIWSASQMTRFYKLQHISLLFSVVITFHDFYVNTSSDDHFFSNKMCSASSRFGYSHGLDTLRIQSEIVNDYKTKCKGSILAKLSHWKRYKYSLTSTCPEIIKVLQIPYLLFLTRFLPHNQKLWPLPPRRPCQEYALQYL